jgi:hypothetical protein
MQNGSGTNLLLNSQTGIDHSKKLLVMSGCYSRDMGYDPSDSLTQTAKTDKTIKTHVDNKKKK